MVSHVSSTTNTHGAPMNQLPPKVIDLASFRQGTNAPEPGETLDFLKAYMQIKRAKDREAVKAMVQDILAGQDQ